MSLTIIDSYMNQIEELLNNENYNEAERLSEIALDELSRFEELIISQGIHHEYRDIIKFKNYLLLIYLGEIKYNQSKIRDSINIYREALSIGESDSNIIQYLDLAIKKDPKLGKVYSYRGMHYYRSRMYEKAYDDFNNALKLDNPPPKLYYYRGLILYFRDDIENSLRDFNKAIMLNPGWYEPYRARAGCYLKKGQKDLAARDIEIYNRSRITSRSDYPWRQRHYSRPY